MLRTEIFRIHGMMCRQCEKTLERAVGRMKGVHCVKADYEAGTLKVKYEDTLCKKDRIEQMIEQTGYSVKQTGYSTMQRVTAVAVILLIWYVLASTGLAGIFTSVPEIKEGMGYAALFAIGLLTSVHCIAMCGGLNLTQSLRAESGGLLGPNFKYNLGRLTSYTVIGGVLGGLGSIISISVEVRAVIGIAAGVCMLFMALNMLNLVPFVRRIPAFYPRFLQRMAGRKREAGSFYLGLLNGLMPCGPLQSMQLLAIASASVLKGALSMFFFCMGTIPLMLFFGIAVTSLKAKWREKIMLAGAALIFGFSLYMIQNNAAILGTGIAMNPSKGLYSEVEDDIQYITTVLQPGSYDEITVKQGIPVEWTITADEEDLNGCNNEVLIPAYGLDVKLQPGENKICFTPEETGTITYSCWMGMIRSSIHVIE